MRLMPASRQRDARLAGNDRTSVGHRQVASGIPAAVDSEAEEHWQPRGRGVESGRAEWLFQGRQAALTEIRLWLEGDSTGPGRPALVVTGDPGSGKSAVLSRMMSLSDPSYRGRSPLTGVHPGTLPPEHSVTLALWAHDKGVEQLSEEIIDALDDQRADAGEPRPNPEARGYTTA
jgi:hypothetical protein